MHKFETVQIQIVKLKAKFGTEKNVVYIQFGEKLSTHHQHSSSY